jgi:DNA-binding NtrC family response regulator
MKKIPAAKIFIVEDNLVYQQLIAKELEKLSGDIHFFTRGESCLEALSLNPSIIVLDYDLAGTLNGLDTLKHIRAANPHVYAILFSNKPNLNNKENISAYGFFDFVEKKPTSFGHLREKIVSSCKIAC